VKVTTISVQRKVLHYGERGLSKLKVKTFWWFFAFSFAGFIYGFYDFITDLKSDKSLDRIELSNQQLESELSKLRTLFLDQKNQDSLFQTNSDKETSNQKRN